MLKDDNEVERYLNQFTPRAVRPLKTGQAARSVWVGRLAAAAMVLLSMAAGLWYFGSPVKKIEPNEVNVIAPPVEAGARDGNLNTIVLTKLALEDPNRFEQQMDEASRRVLPDLRGQHSMLGVFAKQ